MGKRLGLGPLRPFRLWCRCLMMDLRGLSVNLSPRTALSAELGSSGGGTLHIQIRPANVPVAGCNPENGLSLKIAHESC